MSAWARLNARLNTTPGRPSDGAYPEKRGRLRLERNFTELAASACCKSTGGKPLEGSRRGFDAGGDGQGRMSLLPSDFPLGAGCVPIQALFGRRRRRRRFRLRVRLRSVSRSSGFASAARLRRSSHASTTSLPVPLARHWSVKRPKASSNSSDRAKSSSLNRSGGSVKFASHRAGRAGRSPSSTAASPRRAAGGCPTPRWPRRRALLALRREARAKG